MLRLPKLRRTQERTASHIEDDERLSVEEALAAAYSAEDPDDAINALQQIPDADKTRRILAYIDIYEVYKNALNEESLNDLREVIIEDVIKFSGERLPDDIAALVGIPEEYIEETPATGVVDYTDVEAVFKVWDNIDRGDTMANITEALIEQYEQAHNGSQAAATLLEKAFALSRENGSKAHENERVLYKASLAHTQSANRFNAEDDARHQESLRIAAERDRQRKRQRELGAHAAR